MRLHLSGPGRDVPHERHAIPTKRSDSDGRLYPLQRCGIQRNGWLENFVTHASANEVALGLTLGDVTPIATGMLLTGWLWRLQNTLASMGETLSERTLHARVRAG